MDNYRPCPNASHAEHAGDASISRRRKVSAALAVYLRLARGSVLFSPQIAALREDYYSEPTFRDRRRVERGPGGGDLDRQRLNNKRLHKKATNMGDTSPRGSQGASLRSELYLLWPPPRSILRGLCSLALPVPSASCVALPKVSREAGHGG
jgi:hypothetical protein